MKFKSIIISTVFIVLVFQTSLFPLITSRIEGTVIGEEGIPISQVNVVLLDFRFFIREHISSTKTDSKGYFKFDDLKKGEYALLIWKDGFASYTSIDLLKRHLTRDIFTRFDAGDFGSDAFYLKEGQIKHFRIKLQKEAVLIVNVFKKIPSGTTLLNETLTIYILDKSNKAESWDLFEETYKSKYLKGGFYDITIYAPGYPTKIYENFELKKDQNTTIDYILDFTSGQVLHGFVIDKISKKPLLKTSVLVSKIDEEFTVRTRADDSGEFWIGGLKPGSYVLSIHGTIFKSVNYKSTFKIAENELKEVNIIIEGGF